jgi:hypothetical protein
LACSLRPRDRLAPPSRHCPGSARGTSSKHDGGAATRSPQCSGGSYRRAVIKEQTFEGRRENQASTLSRTCATLEALNHHRGKRQRKVTVEHAMYTPAGRLSSARSGPRGEGISRNQRDQPHAKQITHAPEARDVARGREAGACAGRERCLTGVPGLHSKSLLPRQSRNPRDLSS